MACSHRFAKDLVSESVDHLLNQYDDLTDTYRLSMAILWLLYGFALPIGHICELTNIGHRLRLGQGTSC